MMTPVRHLAKKSPLLYRTVRKLLQDTTAKLYFLTHHDDINEVFERCYRLPFSPTHYYSPLPDLPSVKRNLRRWYKESDSPGVDWNLQEQFRLAENIAQYAPEAITLPPFPRVTQDGYGPGYGEVEAYLLYMILRYLKPSKCVEVGSGVSTFYMLSGLTQRHPYPGWPATH